MKKKRTRTRKQKKILYILPQARKYARMGKLFLPYQDRKTK